MKKRKEKQKKKEKEEKKRENKKSYDRDKRVQSLSRGACGRGVKGVRLWSMGRALESLLSMGPEGPRYATEFG